MSHPILNQIGNIILPHNIDMPIIPIKILNWTNKSIVQFHGLPSGLVYNNKNHTINGKPLNIGQFGVTGSVQNELGFDIIHFTITVIKCDVIPMSVKPINSRKVSLGNPIDPIEIIVDNEDDVDVTINGLPHGLTYDPFTRTIIGYPEEVGDFKISVHAINKSGTETVRHFSLLVDGIISPSIIVNTTITELIQDTINSFHQINDQLIYSFIITNTGNIPVQNIIVHIDTWGDFQSDIKLMPNNCTVIKYIHKISLNDLEKESIEPRCIISAEIFNKIKVTLPSTINRISIRGHDNKILNIKRVNHRINHQKKTVCIIYLITNQTDNEITNISIKNQYDDKIVVSSDLIKPHDSVHFSFTSQLQSIYHLIVIGKYGDTTIGNTCDDILCIEDKMVPKMVLSIDKYNKILTMTFKSKHGMDTLPSGKVKFYDYLQPLGNAKIREGDAVLKIISWNTGKHLIYGHYLGDDKYNPNGSNIIEIINDTEEHLHTGKSKKNK